MLRGAQHVYVGELSGRAEEIERNKPVTVYCNSGQRAMIAASILQRQGFPKVENILGSVEACAAAECEIIGSGEGGIP